MKAEILTIGDEILRGEIVDTNKARISERLREHDVEVRFQTSCADVAADMADAFRRAASRVEVVIVSGGLGPTRDDLTIDVLARCFERELVLDPASLEAIRSFFARLGREMAPSNEKQAWLPRGAVVLPNPIGTAPGCMLEAGGAVFFCLPGVPRELDRMLQAEVLPRLAALRRGRGGEVVRSSLLRTFGIGESSLEDALADVAREEGATLGFRTAFPDNYLRPLVRAASAEIAEAKLGSLVAQIRARLGALVYAEGEATLEAVVQRMLSERGLSLAVAESCSGGLLAERITSVPGASEVFRGGVVAYANAAKAELLGVPWALLEQHGAVSEPTARAMAEGVRKRLGADVGVATTGISGPGGGSEDKPVGLVFVALAREGGTDAARFVLPLDRERHRRLTVQVALDAVRRSLLGVEPWPPLPARAGAGR